MKPLNLRMKAFLGFKEETEIDFRPLYEDKIFLITGPTGSGKTSIFDAVAYALYGEGSGETRTKAKCFRSQMAGEKESMEVDLDFEVRGVLYHVHREENYRGVNKSVFYKVSEPEVMWTKIRDVNQEIETIIGLNLDQFKKIVMIPQGEFREFLTAGTKDKSEILKKLFATEQYEIFQRKIKESYDGVVKKDQELVRRFTQIIKDIGLEEKDIELGPDALMEVLEKEEDQVTSLKKEEEENQKNIKELEKILDQAKVGNEELKKFEKVKEDYLNLEEKRPIILEKKETLQLLRKVAKVASLEKELRQKEKEIQWNSQERLELDEKKKNLSTEIENFKQSLSLARDEEKTLDDKKERRTKLKDLISKSIRLEELSKTLTQLTRKSEALQKKLDLLARKKEELDSLKEQLQKDKEESYRMDMILSTLKLTYKEENDRLKVFRVLYMKYVKKENMEINQEELLETQKTIQVLLERAKEKYSQEEEKRNQSYALLLRDHLKEDEPCPVCGSLDHPLTVKLSEHHDQENLQTLKVKVQEMEGKAQDIMGDLRAGQTSYDNLMEEIITLNTENHLNLSSSLDMADKGKDQKQEVDKVEKDQEKIEGNLKNQREALTKLIKTIAESEKMVNDEGDLSGEKTQIEETRHGLKGELRILQSEGTPEDAKNIKKELQELEAKIQQIEAQVKRAKEDHEKALEKDHTLSGRESELGRALVQLVALEKKCRDEFFETLEKEELKREVFENYRDKLSYIDPLEVEINQFDQRYYEKKGIYESLKMEGEKRRFQELYPLEENLHGAQGQEKEKQKELKEKEFLVLNLTKAHTRLGETYGDYTENKKELEIIQSLYDTANLGMGFETFVQSYYFEGILIRANQRLMKMSEGRYQLRRRNETENRREKIGLGLNVFDEYSGTERDVQSLSGGESFKASLSLALGLSDFIESHKGSVNLETIFIDEGFGSLDQDSLDNALECLLELNISGRIVGIISHVTELKDRIPGKIDVMSKPGQGSRVTVNGGTN